MRISNEVVLMILKLYAGESIIKTIREGIGRCKKKFGKPPNEIFVSRLTDAKLNAEIVRAKRTDNPNLDGLISVKVKDSVPDKMIYFEVLE